MDPTTAAADAADAAFLRSKSVDSGVSAECCGSSWSETDLNPAVAAAGGGSDGGRGKEDEVLGGGHPLTPSERVARLLRQSDTHLGHLPHPLFTEMETLFYRGEAITVARALAAFKVNQLYQNGQNCL